MLFPEATKKRPQEGGIQALYSQRKAAQSTMVPVAPLSTGPQPRGSTPIGRPVARAPTPMGR